MSEAKFTKGCWKAGRADMATYVDGSPSKWIYAGDKYCAVASGSNIDDWDEVMANAHLIAAAPEMYEMLRELSLEYSCECGHKSCRIERTRAEIEQLLAKARGEV